MILSRLKRLPRLLGKNPANPENLMKACTERSEYIVVQTKNSK